MRYRILFIWTICLIGCSMINAQNISVKGCVRNKLTGECLSGANVVLQNTNLSTLTDLDGNYIFRNLTSGKSTLTASFVGYVAEHKNITLTDTISNINFSLESKPALLHEIVVTGTGTEHYLKDAPVKTEVISGRTLKEYNGRDIEDVLGGLSASFTFNHNDMGSNIQLNGLKNDYILILLDGKRMNGDVGGQNDLNRINLRNIERIEIVKGAVSSLYGSDAIGGVINFISKKNHDKLSIENTSRVGKFADINQTNALNFSYKKLKSTTNFTLKHTDGWRNTREEWYRNTFYKNSVTKTTNRSTNYTISENIEYQVSNKLIINAEASFYERWTYRPTGKPLLRFNDFYYRNHSYGIGAKYNLSSKNYLSFDLSYDRYDYYYDYTSREYTDYYDENGIRIVYYPGDRVIQSSQRRWLSNAKGVFRLNADNTLSSGIEYVWDELVSPRRLLGDKAEAYSLSAYVQGEWNVTSRFNVTAGLRFGQHKEFGQTVTPKISAMYKLSNFNLRATYSNGFKAPTVKELYYQYYATLISKFKAYYGNTNLKAQKSNYFATNIEYQTSGFKASLTGYYNHLRNMISLQQTETSYDDKLLLVEETMKYVNLAKARTYGIDFTFDADLPMSIKIAGGYSYLDAKAQRTDDEAAADYMKYVHMNATSRHNATFRTSWSHSWKGYRLGLSLNGRYQSKRYYTSDGNAKGYQLWRMNTSHTLVNKSKCKLDINIGIDNLFNYIDKTPFGLNRGTTSPGRNIYASFSIKFQNQK